VESLGPGLALALELELELAPALEWKQPLAYRRSRAQGRALVPVREQ
jgi:hypothetical protein